MAKDKICFMVPGPKGPRKVCLPAFLYPLDKITKIPPVELNAKIYEWAVQQGIKKEVISDLLILETLSDLSQKLSPTVSQKMQPTIQKAFQSVSLPKSIKLATTIIASSSKAIESVPAE